MKKIDLILIVVLAVLLVVAFSPEQISGVHAAAFEQAAPPQSAEVAQAERSAPVSPATFIAIALMSMLFGGMTFLPLLREDNRKHAADR